MKQKFELKPLAAAIGALFATSAFTISTANAEENPFQITDLDTGYMVAGKEGSCGEGKCGEGKCGGNLAVKMMDKNGDGSISWTEWDNGFAGMDANQDGKLTAGEINGKRSEGKCGANKAKEGKCGANKAKEGKCGEKKAKEGSCGEGKCGEGKHGNK